MVGKEVRAVIGCGELGVRVEVAADRSAVGAFMGVGIEGVGDKALIAKERVALRLVAQAGCALEARPAEVGAGETAVDLLPPFSAYIADDNAPAARFKCEAEWIAQPQRIDLGAVAAGIAVEERVVRVAFSRDGVDAQDLARQTVDVKRAHARFRLQRCIAGGYVERAVWPEGQSIHRVRRAIHRQTVAQGRTVRSGAAKGGAVAFVGVAHRVEGSIGAQQHHIAAGQVAIQVGRVGFDADHPGHAGAAGVVAVRARWIIGKGKVDIRRVGKIGVQRDAHQPTVAIGVGLPTDVDKRAFQHDAIFQHLDRAVLARNQHAPRGRHGKGGRRPQILGDHFLDEARRQCERLRLRQHAGRRQFIDAGEQQEHDE